MRGGHWRAEGPAPGDHGLLGDGTAAASCDLGQGLGLV